MLKHLVSILALALTLIGLVPAVTLAAAKIKVGAAAPSLTGADLAGASRRLEDYHGKWVLVDFWASWCNPCMRELPQVVKLHDELASKGDFEVLSVSLDDDRTVGALSEVVQQYRINYPVLYDGKSFGSDLARSWGVSAIPATFLIDPQGRLVDRDIPASEVPTVMQRASSAGFTPLALDPWEELLPDSPSTGRSVLRDLRIHLPLDSGMAPGATYEVAVAVSVPDAKGRLAEVLVRYEVAVDANAQGDGSPSAIQIKDASEKELSDQLNPLALAGTQGKAVSRIAAHLSVEYLKDTHELVFVLPLPASAAHTRYAIGVYDQRLGKYVRSGLREVS